MEREISKTQVDRLGDQLRKGNITDSDLRLLDEYRRSFSEAYAAVAGAIRLQLVWNQLGDRQNPRRRSQKSCAERASA
jgi:hypothetical protein